MATKATGTVESMRGYSGRTEREERMKTRASRLQFCSLQCRPTRRRSRVLALSLLVAAAVAAADRAGHDAHVRRPIRRAARRRGSRFHVARQPSAPRMDRSRARAPTGFWPTRRRLAARRGSPWRSSTATSAGDVSVSARVRLAGGQRSGGIVWRVQDAENYYLARLDLDRQDIGLYRVAGGNRTRIEGEDDLELDTDGVAHAARRAGGREHPGLSSAASACCARVTEPSPSRAARACGARATPSRTSTISGSAHAGTDKDDHADPRRGR